MRALRRAVKYHTLQMNQGSKVKQTNKLGRKTEQTTSQTVYQRAIIDVVLHAVEMSTTATRLFYVRQ